MLAMLASRWWLLVLRGVLALLFGVFAISWPGAAVLVLVLVLWGGYALGDVATALGLAWAARSAPRQMRMVLALLSVAGVLARPA